MGMNMGMNKSDEKKDALDELKDALAVAPNSYHTKCAACGKWLVHRTHRPGGLLLHGDTYTCNHCGEQYLIQGGKRWT